MTMTGAAPGARSASTMTRPMIAGTLAIRNPAAEISATDTSSTDPSAAITLRRIVWKAPTSSTDCRLPRQRSTSCHGVSRRSTGLAVPDLDGDDPVALFERKRTPHDDVERGEHDRRDADRHGHRQPADQRQPPVADEQAEPELDIEPRRAEPRQAALVAQRFERLDAAAGGGPGESRRVVRRVALPAELVFSEGEVSGKLALQVMVGPPATERAPCPPCPLPKRGKNPGGVMPDPRRACA